ncbi:MAG: cell division-specific peptidoglycan biosynthesis regulator FtsW [Verrucomicrobiaceae bacterium]|nr:cell division-specific peptidoglycan biosynthesis regulator FtsW [Verrucomicrobiaceae bacterium]
MLVTIAGEQRVLWPLQKEANWLVLSAAALVLIGVIAMGSASVEYAVRNYGGAFSFVQRYLFHFALGVLAAIAVIRVPMSLWQRTGWIWLITGLVLLALVLIPGIGRTVNGARRWFALGPLTLQVSEFVKVFVIIYLAGYLVRRHDEVRSQWSGFIKPMAVVFMVTLLLMLEPDFGATVVTAGTAFGLVFLAGVRLSQFLLVIMSCASAFALLIFTSPYRKARLIGFTDPWADQFKSGYQLTQSLIAFGRGEWLGVGLGNSVQKLSYLPEAHTDFVFAIWSEEFGFIGALAVLTLFAILIGSMFRVGRRAEKAGQLFSAFVVYGAALLISAQVFINIGVNIGLLPTKGLTLPFLSYGGSSLIVCLVLVALTLRVDGETSGRFKDV